LQGQVKPPFDAQTIDEAVVNEPVMWFMSGSAQMEANISWKEKVDGRSDDCHGS